MTSELTGTDGATVETSASAVSWPAILAGAVVAIAVSLIFLTLGSGLGAAAASPWPGAGPAVKTFTIMTGIWLIVTQWISSATGAYITGRLRTKWTGAHTHEVFFRDTAHGFLTWAVATVAVAAVAAAVASSAGGAAVHAAAAVSDAQVNISPDAARQAADAARKAAASFSIFGALSMLIGAFVACVASALGGQQRDEHP